MVAFHIVGTYIQNCLDTHPGDTHTFIIENNPSGHTITITCAKITKKL